MGQPLRLSAAQAVRVQGDPSWSPSVVASETGLTPPPRKNLSGNSPPIRGPSIAVSVTAGPSSSAATSASWDCRTVGISCSNLRPLRRACRRGTRVRGEASWLEVPTIVGARAAGHRKGGGEAEFPKDAGARGLCRNLGARTAMKDGIQGGTLELDPPSNWKGNAKRVGCGHRQLGMCVVAWKATITLGWSGWGVGGSP